MIIRTYIATDPLPGFEAVAHCYEERKRKGGGTQLLMLPATTHGPTPEVAAERLSALLNAEIERLTARQEHGRRLGQARRKNEPEAA